MLSLKKKLVARAISLWAKKIFPDLPLFLKYKISSRFFLVSSVFRSSRYSCKAFFNFSSKSPRKKEMKDILHLGLKEFDHTVIAGWISGGGESMNWNKASPDELRAESRDGGHPVVKGGC